MKLSLANVLALVLLPVAIMGCEEPVGEVVTCTQTWTCGDDVVADNSEDLAESDPGSVFCTAAGADAAAAEQRAADITAYQNEFAEGCNGVDIRCINPDEDGEFAACTATCVVSGACDVVDVPPVRVRLD